MTKEPGKRTTGSSKAKKTAASPATTSKTARSSAKSRSSDSVAADRKNAPSARRTKPRTRKSVAAVTEDQIRARAYEIYEARANGPGDACSDWFQAERELAGAS